MLNALPAPLVFLIASLLLVINILFWVPILMVFCLAEAAAAVSQRASGD